MQACLASQMTVANMQQRNAAAQDLNTAAFVQQQRATNDTSAANEGKHLADLPALIGDEMLNAINTKILLAILAALTVIGSAVAYQRHETEAAAAAAQKAAAILQQQQNDAEEQKKRDEAFRQQVEKNKKQHNSAAAHEGKTWKTYIP